MRISQIRYYYLIYIIFIANSCNIKNDDSKYDDWKDIDVFSDGQIKRRCQILNPDEKLFLCEQYDSLGNLKRVGKYRNELATGSHNFYNNNHELEYIRQYVIIDGKESYLNQVIKLNSSGDTVKDGSNYFSITTIEDTLTLGETFYATIKLEAPIFESHKIETYLDVPDDTSLVRIIQAENKTIKYDFTPAHRGPFEMKGKIVEMKAGPNKQENLIDVDSRILYFSHSYYVK